MTWLKKEAAQVFIQDENYNNVTLYNVELCLYESTNKVALRVQKVSENETSRILRECIVSCTNFINNKESIEVITTIDKLTVYFD